ncbi:MAG: hypothetical protein E7321_07950 [Clostridiales bacterium]|nr:hypothetical protein [Clostridiales bacterium]
MLSLFRKQPTFDLSALKRTALYSLALLFAAHAFCFFNLTYSSGSVMLNVSSGRSAQIAAGQVLLPLYWRIRGSISSPLLVGMLSTLYLTLTNLVLVWLLRLSGPVSLFALCGATTVNAAVLSICAASLHTADAAFLALLLAALSCACCLRVRLGVFPGVLLLTGALAINPDACAFFAALTLIVMISDLLLSRDAKAFTADALRLVIVLTAAIVLYAAGYMLMLRRSDIEPSVSFRLFGGNLLQAYLAPIRAWLAPLTAYPALSVILRGLLALACAWAIIVLARRHGKTAALVIACAAALPLCCGFTLLSAQAGAQAAPAYCLTDVLAIVLLSRLMPDRAALRRGLCAVFAVLFMGVTVFSNQVYLKKNLEFESTHSLMSRVFARLERTEGYRPGLTPVAVVGTPEDSVFSVERKGFEHLDALDAASGNYAIVSDTDMIWYTWEVMGYPLNFVSTFDLENIRETDDVRAMPAFPQEGCCAFIGDVLVIKL